MDNPRMGKKTRESDRVSQRGKQRGGLHSGRVGVETQASRFWGKYLEISRSRKSNGISLSGGGMPRHLQGCEYTWIGSTPLPAAGKWGIDASLSKVTKQASMSRESLLEKPPKREWEYQK